jgi:hypothetical protein
VGKPHCPCRRNDPAIESSSTRRKKVCSKGVRIERGPWVACSEGLGTCASEIQSKHESMKRSYLSTWHIIKPRLETLQLLQATCWNQASTLPHMVLYLPSNTQGPILRYESTPQKPGSERMNAPNKDCSP